MDIRNGADQMVFQTDKAMGEFGDKVSESEKTEVNAKLEALKEALKGDVYKRQILRYAASLFPFLMAARQVDEHLLKRHAADIHIQPVCAAAQRIQAAAHAGRAAAAQALFCLLYTSRCV